MRHDAWQLKATKVVWIVGGPRDSDSVLLNQQLVAAQQLGSFGGAVKLLLRQRLSRHWALGQRGRSRTPSCSRAAVRQPCASRTRA
jgi:hypothetical protein